MNDFAERVAIVTGGASGLGRGLCLELGREGAVVVVADLDREGAERVAADIKASGGRATGVEVDVSRAGDLQALVGRVAGEHGRLDYMFNNAGLGFWGELRQTNLEQWHRLIDVNLWGVIHGVTAAYTVMARQGFGHIVNTASLAGLVPVPTVIPYATAKHAVVGLSLSLRGEAADLGVKVSVVCPGPVRTNFHEALLLTEDNQITRRPPPGAVDSEQAARMTLRGVRRNKGIIVFPFRARLTWLLARLFPPVIARRTRQSIRNLRASSGGPASQERSSISRG